LIVAVRGHTEVGILRTSAPTLRVVRHINCPLPASRASRPRSLRARRAHVRPQGYQRHRNTNDPLRYIGHSALGTWHFPP
jgi:hypothetical protein